MAVSIGDYAIIGDCLSAALVGRDGSIDWLCWPRFDSRSLFAALLDERRGGRFRVAPTTPARVTRRYLEGTNVLETRFDGAGGALVLTDLMPVASRDEERGRLLPGHEVLRRAECVSGEVEVEVRYEPRPGYGGRAARLRDHRALGLRADCNGGELVLRASIPLSLDGDGAFASARVRLRAGECACFSLLYSEEAPAVLPPLGDETRAAIERTARFWRGWSARTRYDGPYRDAVVRSALALKLLAYAPSGAVVAAPTTSLPERLGGTLNWDYRYCWLRDAALTARALFGLGHGDEAGAFVSWLLHTTRLTRPRLHVLYDVFGDRAPRERELPLDGFRGSRPVRVGNAARDQLQLDVYGEVIDAVTHFVAAGGVLDRETRSVLYGFGRYVCDHWREPDEGIWEPRSGRRQNTCSKVMCWAALDRLVELQSKGHLGREWRARFERERDAIREAVETRCWNERLGSYVSEYDGDGLDASLLLLPWYGFEDAGSTRMRGTLARIDERLGAGDAALYRYRSDDSPGEGAFGICSFWGAEMVALGGGTLAEAEARMEALLARGSDVGLFAEELAPATGEPLGNFPQAFTHVGLINAALSIEERRKGAAGRPLHHVHPTAPGTQKEMHL